MSAGGPCESAAGSPDERPCSPDSRVPASPSVRSVVVCQLGPKPCYPPKCIIWLANKLASGRPLKFYGGPQANEFLRKREFVIVDLRGKRVERP